MSKVVKYHDSHVICCGLVFLLCGSLVTLCIPFMDNLITTVHDMWTLRLYVPHKITNFVNSLFMSSSLS